jgi:nucleotide-binding universal stress UspA family protein/amino acid transporter
VAAPVTHKLSNSLEGALAGGGDPATSPLYVFGPFLVLIVVKAGTGVADITFGPTVWLVVFTIAMVSTMYRLVMRWVTDGSGGSGLSEEEFGGWAVKINSAITFVEYTLTFLVSMSALVTFIADRAPLLNQPMFGIHGFGRLIIAVLLSIATGWLVNRGPRMAARAFGPATMGVLVLLWLMVISTIIRHITGTFDFSILPGFSLKALSLNPTPPVDPASLAGVPPEVAEQAMEMSGSSYLTFTVGGYVRILAVMTGIEVFANLVAAYSGDASEKARKAFGSLIIIMGTAAVTMLIVGPAIFHVSNPYIDDEVSVFTQTMDFLLPQPLAYLGTVVAVLVLLSASAASAQGLQNLALGLSTRRYVPEWLGRQNRFGVADKPVWLEVGICALLFVVAGTEESTYLAIYAAGVFILLSMTGWAVTKRLIRFLKRGFHASNAITLAGAIGAAFLTSVATIIIFYERFFEGAWTYFVFIPLLYAVFTFFRRRLGEPTPEQERLGEIEEAAWGGFGPGQRGRLVPEARVVHIDGPATPVLDTELSKYLSAEPTSLRHILVALDGSRFAEQSLPISTNIVAGSGGKLTLLSVVQDPTAAPDEDASEVEQRNYLETLCRTIRDEGVDCDIEVRTGEVDETLLTAAADLGCDGVAISSRGRSGLTGYVLGSVAREVVQHAHLPTIVVRPSEDEKDVPSSIQRVLVALDGSHFAERMLPYARGLGESLGSEIILLSVPDVPEPGTYGPLADIVSDLRKQSEQRAVEYLEQVVGSLKAEGLSARGLVTGTGPARTIISLAQSERAAMVMMATHGLGGLEGLLVGSVALRVIRQATGPVFLLPIHEREGVGKPF